MKTVKMQTPIQSIVTGQGILMSLVPLCQLFFKNTNPTEAPDPNHQLQRSPASHLRVGGGAHVHFLTAVSLLAGCFRHYPQFTLRFPRFIKRGI